jgi:hypothetical protein
MSQGLKNLQTAARSASRRERMLDTSSSTTIHTPLTSSSISHPGSVPTYGAYEHHDDSGYADELEAEYDADNASDRSSNGNGNGYVHGHYHTHSASSSMGGSYGQGRVSSMDMGIDAIINRPGNGR